MRVSLDVLPCGLNASRPCAFSCVGGGSEGLVRCAGQRFHRHRSCSDRRPWVLAGAPIGAHEQSTPLYLGAARDGFHRRDPSLEHSGEGQRAGSYSTNLDKRSTLPPSPTSECKSNDNKSHSHRGHSDCGVTACLRLDAFNFRLDISELLLNVVSSDWTAGTHRFAPECALVG
jgi:hypothetical protein